jgi:O-antigen ligase
VSPTIAGLLGGLLIALTAAAALRWPRRVLVAVALSPILDRYLVAGVLASDVEPLAHFLSEALLAAVGGVLLLQAWRRGTLGPALNHPTVWLAAAFGLVASAAAALNGVPATQAAAGIGFTLDAVVLFVLARVVGFTRRSEMIAIYGVVGLALLAAVVVILQALLSPHLLGLSALRGRYGELYRLAAFFGDPNTLAAFLSAAIPFAIFGAVGLADTRRRRAALVVATLLILALWLSFSRGGWLGAVGGFLIAGLLLERRALAVGMAVVVVTLGAALVMPRDLLGDAGAPRPDLFGSTFGRLDTIGEGRDLRTLFVVNALPIVADHPLVGVGPGRYGGAAADLFGTPVYAAYGTDALFSNPTQRTVDDFWLHLLVESGLIGFALFAGAVVAAWLPILRAARRATGQQRAVLAGMVGAVAALSINSLTTMLLEANSMAFPFWVLLGIGTALAADQVQEANGRLAGAAT